MTQEKINKIFQALDGVSQSEWNKIQNIMERYFNEKAAQNKLDDLNTLKKIIKSDPNPNIRQFG